MRAGYAPLHTPSLAPFFADSTALTSRLLIAHDKKIPFRSRLTQNDLQGYRRAARYALEERVSATTALCSMMTTLDDNFKRQLTVGRMRHLVVNSAEVPFGKLWKNPMIDAFMNTNPTITEISREGGIHEKPSEDLILPIYSLGPFTDDEYELFRNTIYPSLRLMFEHADFLSRMWGMHGLIYFYDPTSSIYTLGLLPPAFVLAATSLLYQDKAAKKQPMTRLAYPDEVRSMADDKIWPWLISPLGYPLHNDPNSPPSVAWRHDAAHDAAISETPDPILKTTHAIHDLVPELPDKYNGVKARLKETMLESQYIMNDDEEVFERQYFINLFLTTIRRVQKLGFDFEFIWDLFDDMKSRIRSALSNDPNQKFVETGIEHAISRTEISLELGLAY